MNNIKHIFRTLFRYKLSTFVNIVSLFIAFWGIIILSLFISNETSYDNYHKDKDRIYVGGIGTDIYVFPSNFRNFLKDKNPTLENISLFKDDLYNIIYTNESTIKNGIEAKGARIDLDFFNIIDLDFIEKDLTDIPKSIVICKSIAKKLFGNEKALGKTINIGNRKNYKIIGVFNDYKKNTSFKYGYYIPYKWYFNDPSYWGYNIIVKLKKNSSIKDFSNATIKNKDISKIIKQLNERYGKKLGVSLLPINKIHYCTKVGNQLPGKNKININIIHVLGILSILLYMMGIINFINCYTSQASLRAKSIALKQIFGMRKWKSKFIIILEAILLSI